MKSIKVAEATESQLNWLVAMCEGEDYYSEFTVNSIGMEFPATDYVTNPAQAFSIIEREGISVFYCSGDIGEPRSYWVATSEICSWEYGYGPYHEQDDVKSLQIYKDEKSFGSTPLIAAMRCFVTNQNGKIVKVPDNLA